MCVFFQPGLLIRRPRQRKGYDKIVNHKISGAQCGRAN